MQIKHIIWDWNGTLLDDVWLCVEVMNELLQEHELTAINEQLYREWFGFPVWEYYLKLGFPADRGTFEVLSVQFITRYDARRFECNLQPGVQKSMQELYLRGLGQSVLSAYHQATLEEVIAHYRLRDRLSKVVGQLNIYAEGKIDRGRLLMEQLQLAADEVLLVGDTIHDYEVASELGIQCLLIDHGHHPRHRLEVLGVPVLSSLDDLFDHLYLAPSNQ